jgi:SAM-dependent methyltransferase
LKQPEAGKIVMPKSSRQLFLKKMIEVSSAKILEIGALDNPTFHKAEANIFYLDWFSQAELYLKHQYNNPQKAENLVEVDFVVKDKNFHKSINQEFDLVIANHVIEHIPNIIGWFNNVSSLLKNDGFLFLSVPHKEYTFDKIRNLTSLSQIIRNYDEDLNIPTIYQVFEHLYFYRPISALDVWKGDFQELLNQKRFTTAFEALELARSEVSRKGYVDVHCNIFDFYSFTNICNELYSSKYIDLKLVDSKDIEKPDNEFFTIFQKSEEVTHVHNSR